MSYSCLEELQVDLDLHVPDKTSILSKAGCKYKDGWLIVTDDGKCHLFDSDGNLDDIKKVTQLEEKHIRKDITKIVIPDSVRYIKNHTFMYDNKLMSVTIPNLMTNIERGVFFGCNSLMSITLGHGVKSIGEYAFFNCSSLMSMTIPDSITNIKYGTFNGCDKLTNLTFKGKTLEQVKKMKCYPWKIEDESIIRVK